MENKLIIPMIKKYWKLLLSILIITALGASLMIGLSSAHLSLRNSLEAYVEEYNYPDIGVETEILADDVEVLNEIEGIEDVSTRLGLSTTLQDKNNNYLTAKIFSYTEDDFQKMYIWDSLDEEIKQSVMLEYNFAKDNNINIGDKVNIKVGDEYRQYVVSKIVSLPESLAVSISSKQSVATSDFGYIYASKELLANESTIKKNEALEEINKNSNELETKEKESKEVFEQAERDISSSEKELKANIAKFNNDKVVAVNKIKELKDKKAELEATIKDLNLMKSTIQNSLDNFENIYAEFSSDKNVINSSKKIIKLIDSLTPKLDNWYSQYNYEILQRTSNLLKNVKTQINKYLNKKDITEENIEEISEIINSNYTEMKNDFNKGIAECQTKLNVMQSSLNEIEKSIQKLELTISTSEKKLKEAQAKINESKKALNQEKTIVKEQTKEAKEQIDSKTKEVNEQIGYEEYYNQILIDCEENADVQKVKEKVEEALKDLEVLSIDTYEESAVKKRIEINLEPIETLSIFMPILFFNIVMIVVFLFMTLIIKQSRKEIGILRAIGLKKSKIRKVFCLISLIVSIASIIVGTIIGIILMLNMGDVYKNFFPIPKMIYNINWKMFAISTIAIVLIGQISTIVSSISIEKIEPVEAMSRTVTKDNKIPRFIKWVTRNRKPFTKFNLITFYRNRVKVFFSGVSIAASIMLIISSISFSTSKDYLLDEMFNKRINYDAQIFMNKEPSDEVLEKLESIESTKNIEIIKYYNINISANGKTESVVLNAFPKETNTIRIFDENNKELKIQNSGIILEKHIADRLGVKKGDNIQINDKNIKITDISNQCINRVQYISLEQANELEEADFYTILLDINKENQQELLAKMSVEDDYLYTMFTDLMYESNLKTFQTYDIGTAIIIAFAIIIGFIIILNNTLTNLLEQKRKLCVMRVLGFKVSAISRNWFSQSLLQYILSLILGIPMGIVISKISLAQLSTIDREYVYANGIKEFIITAILVFTYILISHILAMKSVRKWDAISAVKEKE